MRPGRVCPLSDIFGDSSDRTVWVPRTVVAQCPRHAIVAIFSTATTPALFRGSLLSPLRPLIVDLVLPRCHASAFQLSRGPFPGLAHWERPSRCRRTNDP